MPESMMRRLAALALVGSMVGLPVGLLAWLASPNRQQATSLCDDPEQLWLAARKMTVVEAGVVEQQIQKRPDDVCLRARAVFYLEATGGCGNDGSGCHEHLRWIVENHPESRLAGSLLASLSGAAFGPGKELLAIWLNHVETRDHSAEVLRNAAWWLYESEPDLARSCLEKALALEPANAELAQDSAYLNTLQASFPRGARTERDVLVRRAHEVAESGLRFAQGRTYVELLAQAGKTALALGDTDRAAAHAQELLDIVHEDFPLDVFGDNVHNAQILLGRVSLRQDDIAAASARLIKAAQVPSSRVIRSFGPDMLLAKRLLEAGQRDLVLEYLEHCKTFWSMGRSELQQWIDDIDAGREPYFDNVDEF